MKSKIVITIIIIALLALPITGCASSGISGNNELEDKDFSFMADLSEFPQADMSGYEGLKDYKGEGPLPFVDVTVQDIHKLMKDNESFVLFVSFANCPWCNAVITQFVEVMNEAGVTAANLNTRKNPAWSSNIDIDDYNLFVEDFYDYIEYDSEGIKHLYVPHVFFVKEGVVVHEHQGALAEMGSDPNMELTKEQNEALKDIYREGLKKILEDWPTR